MARRYRFPMAALLRLRERTEEERKKEFAVAVQAVQEEQDRRERLTADRSALQGDIIQLYKEKAPFVYITTTYRDIGQLAGEILRSEITQRQLEQAVEETRQRLIEAQRERKALEILRDRRKEEYDREMERVEQAALDDMAIRARARHLAENREPAAEK